VQREVRQRRGEGRAARARDGGSAGRTGEGQREGGAGRGGRAGRRGWGVWGDGRAESPWAFGITEPIVWFLGTHANSVLEYIGTDRFLEKLGTEAIRYR